MTIIQPKENQTPEPEAKIKDHCVFLRFCFVLFSILAYLLAIVVTGAYTNGVITEYANFRMTVENGEKILIIWIITFLWGYFILNGLRILFITVLAYNRANRIKKAEERNIKPKKV